MKIIRAPEAAAKCGFSIPTLWRKSKAEPGFPKPVHVSPRVTGWLEEELNSWISQRVAASRRAASTVQQVSA